MSSLSADSIGCLLRALWWDSGGAEARTRDTLGTGSWNPAPSVSLSRAEPPWRPFIFLTAGLVAIYLFLLSLVGGAILPRYLLPVLPLFYLVAVALVMRLPALPGPAHFGGGRRLLCVGMVHQPALPISI